MHTRASEYDNTRYWIILSRITHRAEVYIWALLQVLLYIQRVPYTQGSIYLGFYSGFYLLQVVLKSSRYSGFYILRVPYTPGSIYSWLYTEGSIDSGFYIYRVLYTPSSIYSEFYILRVLILRVLYTPSSIYSEFYILRVLYTPASIFSWFYKLRVL